MIRERIPTPYFPLHPGADAPAPGVEAPVISPRALLGREILNGRFLLQRKVGHSRTTVRFAAHDLMAGMEVAVHLHPDQESPTGYRLGQTGVIEDQRDLPSLCSPRFAAEARAAPLPGRSTSPPAPAMSRVWMRVRAIFSKI